MQPCFVGFEAFDQVTDIADPRSDRGVRSQRGRQTLERIIAGPTDNDWPVGTSFEPPLA